MKEPQSFTILTAFSCALRSSRTFFSLATYEYLVLILFVLSAFGCVRTYHPQPSLIEAQYAYQQGDYYRAFDKLWVPVQHNNVCATYAMGYMYYYGIGTEKDQDIGRSLIMRAANWHYPPAIIAIKLITQERHTQYLPFQRYPTASSGRLSAANQRFSSVMDYPNSAKEEGIWEIKQPLIRRNNRIA